MVTLVAKRFGFMVFTMIVVSLILFFCWKLISPVIRPPGCWANSPMKNKKSYGGNSMGTISP